VSALRLRFRTLADRELLIAGAASLATFLVAFVGARKLGGAALFTPFALALAAIMLRRPVAMVALVVGLVVICEGPTFGFVNVTSHLYDQFYKGLTPLDVLVTLAVVSVGWDLVRNRRPLIIPRPLALPLTVLALAMIAGAVTGHAGGASIRSVVLSENVLTYLLLLPITVANLRIDRRQVNRALAIVSALSIVKALAGMIEVFGHYGVPIEGRTTLTYYEPTTNWLIMVVLLGVVALLLARVRPPLWALLGCPVLITSLVLSYRRSFWIAAVLGLLLVIVLGVSPSGRRLLIPVVLLLVVAVWTLGSVHFQSSGSPVAKRIASLNPSKVEANVQDRYRLDERANVLGAIDEHPITGLGMDVPWAASFRPLSVEHPQGRLYVHFAALWFWLKLGILGLVAYVSILFGSIVLALRVWRRAQEPLLRAFGLASLCAIASLGVVETTASFTGIDPRFTALLAVQIGLLALLARWSSEKEGEPA
jgi:O-antigen ligase